MRLIKIKYRNPALDTQFSYCINNYLWAKNKVKIINNGTEMLVPKFYCPRHVAQLSGQRKAIARYKARQPLKFIKENHEKHQEEQKRKRKLERKKRAKLSEKHYRFNVMVTAEEYKLLWDFLYKEVRDPLKDRMRVRTIEEIMEKRNNGN